MTNITINTKKNVIVMSKAFSKKAEIVGSREYELLQRARKDYPTFGVEVAMATKKSKDTYKG